MATIRLDRALRAEPTFAAAEIAVVNGIRLERWRFWLESYVSGSLLEALGLRSDFVANGVGRTPDWRRWWDEQLAPAQRALDDIAQRLGIAVHRCASLRDLDAVLDGGGVRLLFMVAHHPAATDALELGDRRVSWEVLSERFRSTTSILLVCGSGDWTSELRSTTDLPGGGYRCEMPVRDAMIFLKYFLEEIVHGRGLVEARHIANRRFYER